MKKGFTLIELLVVIVIIAILAAVIFVALDPVTRFKQARDARRWNAVNNILTAVHESIVDNEGKLPSPLPDPAVAVAKTQIGTGVAADDCTVTYAGKSCGTVAACKNFKLSGTLDAYLASIPLDPNKGTEVKTGYSIEVKVVGTSTLITITACDAEGDDPISVTR